jgi:hypothetical protein
MNAPWIKARTRKVEAQQSAADVSHACGRTESLNFIYYILHVSKEKNHFRMFLKLVDRKANK